MERGLHYYVIDALEKYRDHVAIVSKAETLTYQQLEEFSNQVANQLLTHGVKEHDIVALSLAEGIPQIITLLGIMKINATYLPINYEIPTERLQNILATSDCHYMISDNPNNAKYSRHLIEFNQFTHFSKKRPNQPKQSLAPAYVIFTSGSTGAPKGVLMSHAGPLNTIDTMNDLFELSSDDAIIQNADVSFDPSVWLIFWPLCHGAKIVVPDNNKDIEHLCDLVEKHKVRVLHTGPALFSTLVQSTRFSQLESVRLVIGGGQAWQLSHLQILSHSLPQCSFCNVYGPTEASIHITAWKISPIELKSIEKISIGYPIRNMQVSLLDENLNAVKVGESGELCVSGIGLAEGYINQPELTQKAFVRDLNGTRIYKTGDRAAFEEDGSLTFLGRIDDQVQIRGYRVELAEIESVLRTINGVHDTCVLTKGDELNLKLHAFVIANTSQKNIISICQETLKNKLPNYMWPSSITLVDSFPLTSNAKPDKKALLNLLSEAQNSVSKTEEKANTIQDNIRCIWEEILNKSTSPTTNFFDEGGDSLEALKLIANLNNKFNISLSVMDIFNFPTIEKLTTHIEQLLPHKCSSTTSSENLFTSESYTSETYPLSNNQRWLLAVAKESATINNIVLPLKIKGAINVDHLKKSVIKLVNQQPILRAQINLNKEPYMWFRETVNNVFYEEDLSSLSETEQNILIEKANEKLNSHTIHLDTDPLFSIHFIKTTNQSATLLIYFHHLISDPVSAQLVIKNLILFYQELETSVSVALISQIYSQRLLYEQKQRESVEYNERLLDICKKLHKRLKNVPFGLSDETNRSAGFYTRSLSPDLAKSIIAYSKQKEQTLFVTFLSLFGKFLHDIYPQNFFNIGINVSRRHSAEYTQMLGPLSEQAVILFSSDEIHSEKKRANSIKQQLHEILDTNTISLWEIYQYFYQTDSTFSPSDLFNVLFDYEPLLVSPQSDYFDLTPLNVKPTSEIRRHLTFRVSQTQTSFDIQIRYRQSLFDEAKIADFASKMIELLETQTETLATI